MAIPSCLYTQPTITVILLNIHHLIFDFSENIFLLPRASCVLLGHVRYFNCWQSILVSNTHPLRATKLPKLSPGSLQRFTFSDPPAVSSHHHPLSNKEMHEVKWYSSGFLNLVHNQHPSRRKAQNVSVTALGGNSLNLPSRRAAGTVRWFSCCVSPDQLFHHPPAQSFSWCLSPSA